MSKYFSGILLCTILLLYACSNANVLNSKQEHMNSKEINTRDIQLNKDLLDRDMADFRKVIVDFGGPKLMEAQNILVEKWKHAEAALRHEFIFQMRSALSGSERLDVGDRLYFMKLILSDSSYFSIVDAIPILGWEYETLEKLGTKSPESDEYQRRYIIFRKIWLDKWYLAFDDQFDESKLPGLNQMPPTGTGLPPGVAPSEVKDKKMREAFLEQQASNIEYARYYELQVKLRKIKIKYPFLF